MQIKSRRSAIALLLLTGITPPHLRAQQTSLAGEPVIEISSPIPVPVVHRVEIDAAIRARDWEPAERLLAVEIERQPRSRELLALLARIFFLDGKPLNAAVALKKAEAIRPLDDELRFTLALAYVRLGRGDWARPEFERLVESDPAKAVYRYWVGRLDYDSSKYIAAIGRFNETLARDPQFLRAHDNLGLCYQALDEPDQAIAHFREAVRLNRHASAKSPWPPTNLAILLRQRGAPEEAASLLQEAVHYDARFAIAHYQLGLLLEEQGRSGEAVGALRLAAAIDPGYAEPHYVLARIYRRQGRGPQADEALATFLRLREPRDQGER